MQPMHRILAAIVLMLVLLSSTLFAGITSVTTRAMTAQEVASLKALWGVYQPGTNYNVIVNGHGTVSSPVAALSLTCQRLSRDCRLASPNRRFICYFRRFAFPHELFGVFREQTTTVRPRWVWSIEGRTAGSLLT